MTEEELKARTKKFALRIISLVEALPKNRTANAIGNQIVRSGTAVGANYRAVCRARSEADFLSKIGIVIEEADETCFWLELIIEARVMRENLVKPLLVEANEITAIMVASRITMNKKRKS